MSVIIAGRFEEQSEVEIAVQSLRNAGFPADQISSFFLSPAGQHARYSMGGDHDKSVGAEESVKGTAAGTTPIPHPRPTRSSPSRTAPP